MLAELLVVSVTERRRQVQRPVQEYQTVRQVIRKAIKQVIKKVIKQVIREVITRVTKKVIREVTGQDHAHRQYHHHRGRHQHHQHAVVQPRLRSRLHQCQLMKPVTELSIEVWVWGRAVLSTVELFRSAPDLISVLCTHHLFKNASGIIVNWTA